MIHCKECLIVLTNSVGSGTVLCKECQAKGDPDIFDTQPTCGELSCDECNERYKKAVNRIQALEEVFRKLQMTGLAVEALLADEPTSVYIHPEIWAKLKEHRGHLRRSLELLKGGW